jgi:hypothetical protein
MSDFCLVYTPITKSHQDTQDTRDQIDANNGKYECQCLHSCPKDGPVTGDATGGPSELVPWLK